MLRLELLLEQMLHQLTLAHISLVSEMIVPHEQKTDSVKNS